MLGVGVFALTSALTAGLTWGISTVEDLAGGTYCLYSDRDCYDWVEMVRKVSVEGVNIEIVNQSSLRGRLISARYKVNAPSILEFDLEAKPQRVLTLCGSSEWLEAWLKRDVQSCGFDVLQKRGAGDSKDSLALWTLYFDFCVSSRWFGDPHLARQRLERLDPERLTPGGRVLKAQEVIEEFFDDYSGLDAVSEDVFSRLWRHLEGEHVEEARFHLAYRAHVFAFNAGCEGVSNDFLDVAISAAPSWLRGARLR